MDEKSASIAVQNNVLEQIALQKIVYKDYTGSKKVEPAILDQLVSLTQGQMLITLYKKDFEEKLMKQSPFELITIQMLVLRGSPEETQGIGQTLLSNLQSAKNDSEIDSIVRSNTMDENRKSIAGYLEPFCLNCGPNPFEDILREPLEKKDGKFYLTQSGDMLYILRIVETRNIYEKSLLRFLTERFKEQKDIAMEFIRTSQDEAAKENAKYFANANPEEKGKGFYDHLTRQFKNSQWQSELERIRESSGIKVEEPPMLTAPEDLKLTDFPESRVLASLTGGKTITFGSFQKEFQELSKILARGQEPTPKQEAWDMLNFFYNIYLSSLYLQEDATASKTTQSQLYQDSLNYLRYTLVWTLFMKDITGEKVEVSENDIREHYEAGKLFAYSTPDPKNAQKRTPLPYSQVRDRIREELENSKKQAIFDAKITNYKTDFKLKVASEALKPGKI